MSSTDRRTDGRTDRRTDGRTRWIQYTPLPTSLGGGIIINIVTYWCQVQSPVCTGMMVIGISNRKWDCVVPVLRYTEYRCTTLQAVSHIGYNESILGRNYSPLSCLHLALAYRYNFEWRGLDIMTLCTGIRVNTNHERIASRRVVNRGPQLVLETPLAPTAVASVLSTHLLQERLKCRNTLGCLDQYAAQNSKYARPPIPLQPQTQKVFFQWHTQYRGISARLQ